MTNEVDQLGDNWAGIDSREAFRRINSQLKNGWYCTLVSLRARVGLQLAPKRYADAVPRHYEYGDTLDEALANAVRFTEANPAGEYYESKRS